MSMQVTKKLNYNDGRTKQAFKDETDINKILKRAQKTGTILHLNKYEGRYGDFGDFDFFEAQMMLTKGREIFDALPSEIRNEFGQSQGDFFAYVNDPANKDRLEELLPALAAPGRQNIDVSGKTSGDVISEPVASESKPSTEVADGTKGPVSEPQEPPAGPPEESSATT